MPIDEKTKRDIRIYHGYGYSYQEISERTGALFSEIRHAIQEGVDLMANNIQSEQKNKISDLLRDGKNTNSEIAAECGVSVQTVKNVRKELGDTIPPRKKGRKKNEPAAEATVTDSEENAVESISNGIIPETEENVKTLDNPDDDYYEESEMYDTVAELVELELSSLRTQIKDLQHNLDRCIHRRELLCEYMKMNGRAVKEDG